MPATSRTSIRRRDDRARAMRGALPLVAAALLLLACQDDFERPAFDNPNDPANGNLPPTPVIEVHEGTCVGGPDLRIDWQVSSEAGISEYQVFRSESAAVDPGELILHVPVGTREVTDSDGLIEGQSYTYRVRAIGTDGLIGLRSDAVSATVICSLR
jgi:hypothetical protein